MSLLSATMLLGSCGEDFLEQEPYDAVPVGEAINSPAELQTAVFGMYASLRTADAYGRTIPVLGDLMADNTYVAPLNSGRYLVQNVYRTEAVTGEPREIWTALYASILRANQIINADIPSTPVVEQLKGEAYAVRALAYHELVKFFAQPFTVAPNAPGVPIITEFDPENPTDYYVGSQPSRNSVAEVYELIISDYQTAYELMEGNFVNSSYMNKWAARALQARAYLFMGAYEEAEEAALDVVTNSGFELVELDGFLDYWASRTPSSAKEETLFEISYDDIDNVGTNALANIYNQAGYGDILATEELVSLYGENDIRGIIPNVDDEGARYIVDETDGDTINITAAPVILVGARGNVEPAYINNKYQYVSGDRNEVKVIRYAEVLLILAEAYARTGEEAKALEILNELAEARNAAPLVGLAGDELLEAIIVERRKELAFEGHRFWTLARLNLPIEREPEQPASTALIEVGNFRRIFPIPQAEIDANPNIEQNPGYGL
ncbi:RagB/SusD family nutrient uptake outer membrane protein [Pontibacter ummariensis]|nr:RagB/SusD family nutrient uptake outer membrane protein [Pontibacter ummariensis]